MAIEIEKKYHLTSEQEKSLRHRLVEVGATQVRGREFEENTLYTGPGLEQSQTNLRALRLRLVGNRAVLTFKERDRSDSPIKHQREEETEVCDAAALCAILEALGYRPALVYEKRRTTWRVAGAEVVLDELPFGLFVEIEGTEESINEAENLLRLSDVAAEHATYPELSERYGARNGTRIEARLRENLNAGTANDSPKKDE